MAHLYGGKNKIDYREENGKIASEYSCIWREVEVYTIARGV